jgi:hypothetical protein
MAPPPAETQEEPPPPPLTLVLSGVATGPGVEMAILVDPSDHGVKRMRTGDEHDGWRLERIDRVSATFRRGEEEEVLTLKPPGVAPAAAGGRRSTGSSQRSQPVEGEND